MFLVCPSPEETSKWRAVKDLNGGRVVNNSYVEIRGKQRGVILAGYFDLCVRV